MSSTFQNLTGPEITLPQMLATRDWRAAEQLAVLQAHPSATLVWSSVRIPGPIKTGPQLTQQYQAIMTSLTHQYGAAVLVQMSFDRPTGFEFYLVLDVPAAQVKRALIQFEQQAGFAQLCDLDVLTLDAGSLKQTSRQGLALPVRPCLICGGDAKACSRSRKHGLLEVQQAVDGLITEGWREV